MKLRPWEFYDRIARAYDSMYETPKWKLYHRLIGSFLEEYLKNPCRVLDLGGGTGKWSLFLQERGFEVVLVDPSKEMLEVAREKGVKNVVEARAEDLPFPSGAFEAVLALGDVLSYVENKDKAFSEIRRVLVPDGLLIATVDNFYTFLQQMIEKDAWDQITRFLKTQTTSVGTTLFSFNSYAFKPEDLDSLEGFETVDIRGIGVMEYPDERISEREETIFRLERELSKDRNIIWKADHIFFVLKKKRGA
ncbi:Methyltransferase type 11 [Thermotoga petrophila RKU-10]|jgi:ubiquinone/menaquinone biosynthesis C-methylase UbiE|uniref:Methyltransferase type 11 n=1 Tax=Thermotoga petrophila (strain ATCC BAA-489 / DSM 13996 / JCM 10882 / RKU-10) TaxID=590168 RepID=D2C442_THEP2|nr:class I SAM-dependent methyltransferase [Thermotoga petrophila]ADA67496.1 Methyltransferase type 11 [Thermotoga petrophila RKU-10]